MQLLIVLTMFAAKDINKTQMLQMIEIENIKTQQLRTYKQKQMELTKKYTFASFFITFINYFIILLLKVSRGNEITTRIT